MVGAIWNGRHCTCVALLCVFSARGAAFFLCLLFFVLQARGFCSLLLVWFELLVGGVLNVGALPAMGGG